MALPLVHNLAGVKCLVVGAGIRAARKSKWLLSAGADLFVVAPERTDEFKAELDGQDYTYLNRTFEDSDLDPSVHLVVCATDDRSLNTRVFEIAIRQHMLVNCVDDPAHCNITFPAIVDRSPLVISISSGGLAPALARTVRGWIEELLPNSLNSLFARIATYRAWFKEQYPDIEDRTRAYNRLLTRQSIASIPNESDEEVLRRVSSEESQGCLTLVGAGPGDPELITLKGMRAIQTADVILYDQLANHALLDYARRDAQCIYVGKQGPKPGESAQRKNNRSMQQHSINDLILQAVREGQDVVRLKGGDPFIYGRGGEEMEVVARAGFEVSAIPGITAALGAASYTGIPLTHRDYAQSVRFVTGHRVENTVNLDWPELGKAEQTLVIYMGLVGLAQIAEKLIAFGAPGSRPVALIERATLPEQRIVTGTLSNIAIIAEEKKVNGPTVAIVGEVVNFLTNTR